MLNKLRKTNPWAVATLVSVLYLCIAMVSNNVKAAEPPVAASGIEYTWTPATTRADKTALDQTKVSYELVVTYNGKASTYSVPGDGKATKHTLTTQALGMVCSGSLQTVSAVLYTVEPTPLGVVKSVPSTTVTLAGLYVPCSPPGCPTNIVVKQI